MPACTLLDCRQQAPTDAEAGAADIKGDSRQATVVIASGHAGPSNPLADAGEIQPSSDSHSKKASVKGLSIDKEPSADTTSDDSRPTAGMCFVAGAQCDCDCDWFCYGS